MQKCQNDVIKIDKISEIKIIYVRCKCPICDSITNVPEREYHQHFIPACPACREAVDFVKNNLNEIKELLNEVKRTKTTDYRI